MIPATWKSRVAAVALACAGLFAGLCIFAYDPRGIPLLSSAPSSAATTLAGTIGAWLGFLSRGLFGWGSVLLPLVCLLWAYRLWQDDAPQAHAVPMAVAGLCAMASLGALLALQGSTETAQADLGGVAGLLLARSGTYYLGVIGTVLTALCAGFLSWVVLSGMTFGATGLGVLRRLGRWLTGLWHRRSVRPSPAAPPVETAPSRPAIRSTQLPGGQAAVPPEPAPEPRVRISRPAEFKPKAAPGAGKPPAGDFQLPSLELLADPPPVSQRRLAEDLQANAKILEETLRDFGIEAHVVNIDRGPTVTRYELTPAPGVKLTKIASLSDDIALVMKAASCHIVAPIPSKGTVGVDVPNSTATVVYLKEILAAPEFAANPSPLALPIGKDVSGAPVVANLTECPHLLIAGATGSGKTVCLNSLLVGIMTHATPEQVRFLMIDPKMVELAMFNDIPHLVAPVVTNAKKASAALHWAVQEMERRYQLFAKAGVRNIEFYNRRMLTAPPAQAEEPLPYLVIVIDELADLMMIAAQDVESAVARLAQLSRAVGLHMILATQRPSVDVITGVIKANFPARIAFQVASKVDSRTILDANGADKLLGRGDLLFLKPGAAKPVRAQGAYVTDGEIEQVMRFLKAQQPPWYDPGLLESQHQPSGGVAGEKDEMYEQAKELVLSTGQASTSLLQRRLRLGYGRAARILDLMEQEGLVGPPQGSRPREVLVSREALLRESSEP
ncbi:MAG: DNA translocase FtsK 4TM domain-containing protein [Candidatus Omnitrophica bacterium]|nr:DNA translocase FtsK 4TM domain-containing protein [Candidatus Omnitrophota bacterium]